MADSSKVQEINFFEKCIEITESLARIEERVTLICAKMDDQNKKLSDMEQRIRELERFKYTVMGVAGAVSILISTIIGLIIKNT